MNYDQLRHLADSWGLIFMGFVFLGLIGWTFRPGAARHHEAAANLIFDDDGQNPRSAAPQTALQTAPHGRHESGNSHD